MSVCGRTIVFARASYQSEAREVPWGKGLALREIVVIMAIIARSFRFERASDDIPGLKYNLVLRPDSPIKLKVFQR